MPLSPPVMLTRPFLQDQDQGQDQDQSIQDQDQDHMVQDQDQDQGHGIRGKTKTRHSRIKSFKTNTDAEDSAANLTYWQSVISGNLTFETTDNNGALINN